MDDNYVCEHLLKYCHLIYGKEKEKYCYAKKVNGKYIFGYASKKEEVRNVLTRPFALYLCAMQKVKINYQQKRKRRYD
jgi:hypothetical protein